MRIAVTGTSGRIGRAIHFTLCEKHEIVGIDRTVSSATTHRGEINDYEFLVRAFTGVEAVVHTAALHAPHVGVFDESEFFRINVEGTKTVFRAAVNCGVKALVFTSTTALYGFAARQPDQATWISETTIPKPRSIYHRTKLEAEHFLESVANRNLRVTTLRVSRCFPEPAPLMAMYRLHRGIDARDVAEGHRLALAESKDIYRMFILSGATPFRQADCVALMRTPRQVLDERYPAVCELFDSRQWPLPESIDRVYDSSRAQGALGWAPSYGFEEVVHLLDAQIPEVLPAQAAGTLIAE